MTLKEAKKILKKEGFHVCFASMVINQTGAIREFEKPEVCEAIKVANANKLAIGLSPVEWDEREDRLKNEYGKNHIKRGDPIPCSPALKEAASQFNDALLDEQGKKIKRFVKEIARLKKNIRKKNLKIAEKDEVIDNLGKELAEQYKELISKEKEINELLFKFEGARSFLLRSQRENEEKCKTEESLLKRIDELELMLKQREGMLKQREGMLRLSDAGNDFKDAMLDHISKSYDKSQKRIAAFMYNSLSKSKELGNGLVERMEPIRRKRKKTKK